MKKIHPKDFKRNQCIRFLRKSTQTFNDGYMIITRSTENGTYGYRWSNWDSRTQSNNDVSAKDYVEIYELYLMSKSEIDLFNLQL